jgi:hypothetical protein
MISFVNSVLKVMLKCSLEFKSNIFDIYFSRLMELVHFGLFILFVILYVMYNEYLFTDILDLHVQLFDEKISQ